MDKKECTNCSNHIVILGIHYWLCQRIEQDVSELNSVSRRLELNVIKLETIVSRLEKMIEDR
jgi:hypothetical protein